MTMVIIFFIIVLTLILRFLIGVDARSMITFYLLGLIIFLFGFTVAEMPAFGSPLSPAFNEVPQRYLEMGTVETGAINIVSSVINDYRAFDTLGEATVLFVAIAAVIATLKSH